MQAQETGGSIINIASVSGTRPPRDGRVRRREGGLLNLTRPSPSSGRPKVRVNAITAGMIRTEQAHLHYGDEAGVAAVAATVPLGRLGEPRDVADVCLFLASPLAPYVTGASILVHGGGEKPAFLAAAKPQTLARRRGRRVARVRARRAHAQRRARRAARGRTARTPATRGSCAAGTTPGTRPR
jgi:hypothetical protein